MGTASAASDGHLAACRISASAFAIPCGFRHLQASHSLAASDTRFVHRARGLPEGKPRRSRSGACGGPGSLRWPPKTQGSSLQARAMGLIEVYAGTLGVPHYYEACLLGAVPLRLVYPLQWDEPAARACAILHGGMLHTSSKVLWTS